MPGTKRLLAPLALAAAVAALSACGSNDVSGQIPAADAGQLNGALEAVRNDIAVQDCDGASVEVEAFVDGVNQLPASAGEDLKQTLRDAGGNLEQLVNEQCAPTEPAQPTHTRSTEPSSTVPSTSTTSSSTTSSTDTTTTTTTTSTTDTNPQGDEGGNGGGGAGGNEGGGDGGTGGGTGGTGG